MTGIAAGRESSISSCYQGAQYRCRPPLQSTDPPPFAILAHFHGQSTITTRLHGVVRCGVEIPGRVSILGSDMRVGAADLWVVRDVTAAPLGVLRLAMSPAQRRGKAPSAIFLPSDWLQVEYFCIEHFDTPLFSFFLGITNLRFYSTTGTYDTCSTDTRDKYSTYFGFLC